MKTLQCTGQWTRIYSETIYPNYLLSLSHLYISLKQLKEDPCLGETLQPGGCRLPDGQLGLLEIRIIRAIDQNPLNARYTGADQPLNCKQCNPPLQAAFNKLHHYRS